MIEVLEITKGKDKDKCYLKCTKCGKTSINLHRDTVDKLMNKVVPRFVLCPCASGTKPNV